MPFQKNNRLRKGLQSPMKGKNHTQETKDKIGLANSKHTAWNKGKKLHYIVWNKGLVGFGKGKIISEDCKNKMRISRQNYIMKIGTPRLGKQEKVILDILEKELLFNRLKILRQYPIKGYFIDGYIPELNLAIEIDEKPKDKQKDIKRESFIRNELNCNFLRIPIYQIIMKGGINK